MTEWNDRNLVCSGEPCQTHPVIVHLELVNAVSIWDFDSKLSAVKNELQLDFKN